MNLAYWRCPSCLNCCWLCCWWDFPLAVWSREEILQSVSRTVSITTNLTVMTMVVGVRAIGSALHRDAVGSTIDMIFIATRHQGHIHSDRLRPLIQCRRFPIVHDPMRQDREDIDKVTLTRRVPSVGKAAVAAICGKI